MGWDEMRYNEEIDKMSAAGILLSEDSVFELTCFSRLLRCTI